MGFLLPVDTTGRGRRLAAVLLVLLLAGCGGLPKTAEQNRRDDQRSKAAQALRMAETIATQGDPASARAFYMRAVAHDPRQPEAVIGLARAAAAAGEVEEAAQAYGEALALAPGDRELPYEFGRVLLATGRSGEAAVQLARFVADNPADARGYSALGIARDTSGDHAGAQTAYLDGLVVAPDHAGLRNNLALSLAFAGQYRDALAVLDELADEGQPGTRRNLALVHALAGNTERAAALLNAELPRSQIDETLAWHRSLQGLSGAQLARAVLAGRPAGASRRTAPHRRAVAPQPSVSGR